MRVIYVSYHSEVVHRLTTYAILSFLRAHGQSYPIQVFTDCHRAFAPLEDFIEITCIDAEILDEWTREAVWKDRYCEDRDYHWMPKLHIFSLQEQSFVFFDSDTYILRPMTETLRRVDRHNSLMYETEARLKSLPWFGKFTRHWRGSCLDGDMLMWNSGVLGVHESNTDIFKGAIELAKRILAANPFVHTAEQLAIASLLLERTTIHRAGDSVCHYYTEKTVYDRLMQEAIEQLALSEIATLCLKDPEAAARILRLPPLLASTDE